jgi:hypothetical protein
MSALGQKRTFCDAAATSTVAPALSSSEGRTTGSEKAVIRYSVRNRTIRYLIRKRKCL